MYSSNEKVFWKLRLVFHKISTTAFLKTEEGIRYCAERMLSIISIINEENISNDRRISRWLLSEMWMHENDIEYWKKAGKKVTGVHLIIWGES